MKTQLTGSAFTWHTPRIFGSIELRLSAFSILMRRRIFSTSAGSSVTKVWPRYDEEPLFRGTTEFLNVCQWFADLSVFAARSRENSISSRRIAFVFIE